MLRILDSGLDGGFFRDSEMLHGNPYNWQVYRRGGSRGFLERVIEGDSLAQGVMKRLAEIDGVRVEGYRLWASY